jgi:hypothetical protein
MKYPKNSNAIMTATLMYNNKKTQNASLLFNVGLIGTVQYL